MIPLSWYMALAVVLFCIPMVDSPGLLFWVMLLNMIFYMPTISLSMTRVP